jgi:hypothetical protein
MVMKRFLRIFLVQVSVLLFVSSCQDTNYPAISTATIPPAATITPKPEWQTYSNKSVGFSIDLPSTWKVVDTGEDAINSSIVELAKDYPAMGEYLKIQSAEIHAFGYQFFGIDPLIDETSNIYPASVSLLVEDVYIAWGPEHMIDEGVPFLEMQANISKPVKAELVDTKNHVSVAALFTYSEKIFDATGRSFLTQVVQFEQHQVLSRATIVLRCDASQYGKYEDIFRQIWQRFRVITDQYESMIPGG